MSGNAAALLESLSLLCKLKQMLTVETLRFPAFAEKLRKRRVDAYTHVSRTRGFSACRYLTSYRFVIPWKVTG